MRRMVVIATLLLLSGCGWPFGGDDEPEERAKPKVTASTSSKPKAEPEPGEPVVESPTDVCDNIDGKQEVAPDGLRSVPLVDGSKLYCLSADSTEAYAVELRDRAKALVEPLRVSFARGGSPQIILRDLTQLGCGQSSRNLYFWGEANDLYTDVLNQAPKESLARDWPRLYMVAIAQDCF